MIRVLTTNALVTAAGDDNQQSDEEDEDGDSDEIHQVPVVSNAEAIECLDKVLSPDLVTSGTKRISTEFVHCNPIARTGCRTTVCHTKANKNIFFF